MHVALAFGPVATVGAYAGARFARYLSGAVQLSLFAVVLFVAAYFMWRNGDPGKDGKPDLTDGSVGRLIPQCAVPGMAVGILTGLVGVGGGFLVVPVFVLLGEVPMQTAVGTSLLVIARNSCSGFARYLGEVESHLGLVSLLIALAVLGIFAGAYLVRFVPQHALERTFAAFLVVMAVFICTKMWVGYFESRDLPEHHEAQTGLHRSSRLSRIETLRSCCRADSWRALLHIEDVSPVVGLNLVQSFRLPPRRVFGVRITNGSRSVSRETHTEAVTARFSLWASQIAPVS